MDTESKKNQPALPNADTRRGGKKPSSERSTPFTTPNKVQCQKAENPKNWATSDFVPKGKMHWFVFRATYGRTDKANETLKAAGIETYLPVHYVIKEIDGKRKFVQEPLLPNIIFAHMTREKTHEFVKEPAPSAKWLKYYIDKTKHTEDKTGKNPPVIIPDNEMDNFIKLTSVNSEHIMVLPPERCHFKSGDLVRIINGPFTGVIGRVGRAAGQQRVFVELEGIGNVATAYIPNDFIQKLDFFSHQ